MPAKRQLSVAAQAKREHKCRSLRVPKSLSCHLIQHVDVRGAMIFSESRVCDGGKLQEAKMLSAR
jgi:hypothetical protein